MGLLEICCEKQPSDCFEILTFAGLASQGNARELPSFATTVILKRDRNEFLNHSPQTGISPLTKGQSLPS